MSGEQETGGNVVSEWFCSLCGSPVVGTKAQLATHEAHCADDLADEVADGAADPLGPLPCPRPEPHPGHRWHPDEALISPRRCSGVAAADPLADGWVDAAPITEARDRHRRCTLGECVHYDVVPCEVLLAAAALDAERVRAEAAEAAVARVEEVVAKQPPYSTAHSALNLRAGWNACARAVLAALDGSTG